MDTFGSSEDKRDARKRWESERDAWIAEARPLLQSIQPFEARVCVAVTGITYEGGYLPAVLGELISELPWDPATGHQPQENPPWDDQALADWFASACQSAPITLSCFLLKDLSRRERKRWERGYSSSPLTVHPDLEGWILDQGSTSLCRHKRFGQPVDLPLNAAITTDGSCLEEHRQVSYGGTPEVPEPGKPLPYSSTYYSRELIEADPMFKRTPRFHARALVAMADLAGLARLVRLAEPPPMY